jgi:3-methyladenine DNA glycosylase AlkD
MKKIKKELLELRNEKRANVFKRFYKTEEGGYSHGEIFLGIPVPKQKEIAKRYLEIPLEEIKKLLKENIHECKMCASIILVEKFKKEKSEKIIDFYLKNAKLFCNWDLVDLTAPKILGEYLQNKKRKMIYSLLKSKNIWERRIAIVSTHRFIKENDLDDAVAVSKKLLEDKEDLIQKAVGWTLREVGKKNKNTLEEFLIKNNRYISRTTLRYSIEKFSKKEREFYLSYKLSSGDSLNPNRFATAS